MVELRNGFLARLIPWRLLVRLQPLPKWLGFLLFGTQPKFY